jgi:16S rRNA (cytosine1402-N4)-methyltransferase
MTHIPVMTSEVIEIFAGAPDGILIDATFGLGGHAIALHRSLGSRFKIIGIDADSEVLAQVGTLPEDISVRNMRFSALPAMIQNEGIGPVSGILFDLGLNSAQLDDPSRGFSFSQAGPIDMRFDRTSGDSVSQVIRRISAPELVTIIWEYGEERHARAIARAIIETKPETTDALAAIVKRVVGPGSFTKSAARVFQALRIYVNRELDELKNTLYNVIPLLTVGGRIAVISYHSLEDRIVKRQFKLNSGKCFCAPDAPVCTCGKRNLLQILSKKPVRPSGEEVAQNSRARAARLRYAERV